MKEESQDSKKVPRLDPKLKYYGLFLLGLGIVILLAIIFYRVNYPPLSITYSLVVLTFNILNYRFQKRAGLVEPFNDWIKNNKPFFVIILLTLVIAALLLILLLA